MNASRVSAVLFVCLLLACKFTQAQTGFPPYGSFEDGRFDAINRQNLNTNFSIPIVTRAGRGLPFNFSLVYDSLVWSKSETAWAPAGNWGWKIEFVWGSITWKYTETLQKCFDDFGSWTWVPVRRWDTYRYTDAAGTIHNFGVNWWENDCPSTGGMGGVAAGYAQDGSGYYIDISSAEVPAVRSTSGVSITNSRLTDTNGNYLQRIVVSSTVTEYKDTLGKTSLRITKNPGVSTLYQVLRQDGNYNDYTLNYGSTNVNTSFACPGVAEYSGTARVPTSLNLPNGRSYTFEYDAIGRLKKVVLPTGGFYEYVYTNFAVCADGTYSNLTRNVSDGTTTRAWGFARLQVDATTYDTHITAPQLSYDSAANQAVYRFVNGYETSRKLYQGAVAGGTLLEQVDTTYAANGSPATRKRTVGNKTSQALTNFDDYGNLLLITESDWGASPNPGPALRTTQYLYLAPSGNNNMRNRVTQIMLKAGDGVSGVIQSRTDIGYDERPPSPCPTSVANHDDAGCAYNTRGNATSVTTYENAVTSSGALTKNIYYDSLGNVVQAEADCCREQRFSFSAVTQYAFPDSITSGAAGGPQVTTSATYNLNSALVETSTDANNKVTAFTYDNTFYRSTNVQRPDAQNVTYAYDDVNRKVTAESPIQAPTEHAS